MNTKLPPQEFVVKLLERSSCRVQVAACLSDRRGVYCWGINHSGSDGLGEHAEIFCLKRANPKRVTSSVMWIAARRIKSKNPVSARPCAACVPAVKECLYIYYREKDLTWQRLL